MLKLSQRVFALFLLCRHRVHYSPRIFTQVTDKAVGGPLLGLFYATPLETPFRPG